MRECQRLLLRGSVLTAYTGAGFTSRAVPEPQPVRMSNRLPKPSPPHADCAAERAPLHRRQAILHRQAPVPMLRASEFPPPCSDTARGRRSRAPGPRKPALRARAPHPVGRNGSKTLQQGWAGSASEYDKQAGTRQSATIYADGQPVDAPILPTAADTAVWQRGKESVRMPARGACFLPASCYEP